MIEARALAIAAGLEKIAAYLRSHGEGQKDTLFIPVSDGEMLGIACHALTYRADKPLGLEIWFFKDPDEGGKTVRGMGNSVI